MGTAIEDILDKIHALEKDLQKEFDAQRERFHYEVKQRVVRFEREALERQKVLRKGLAKFIIDAKILNILSAPVIYALVLPLILLDLSLSLYQLICFPLYGVRRVPRADFIVLDRHHLAYLNIVEKINCTYCAYANGVIAYGREIASRTEERWCPIKHAQRTRGAHHRYYQFDDYGDAESFRKRENHKVD